MNKFYEEIMRVIPLINFEKVPLRGLHLVANPGCMIKTEMIIDFYHCERHSDTTLIKIANCYYDLSPHISLRGLI